ncbi:TPA: 7-cyano-7-deazaguanine synthase [Klebsiella pneumoniae]|uniref:7-cyano-7-deazaguanine synthase n=2 Tax=Klebsiella pneumoniae TaxID=573 RepID=A0A483JEZ2_KLEPN|nr:MULTISPECIES: 7-cyano-7-deazaguanine synthase [Enterobacteriaceae]HBX1752263.1 7-cyano-7-deazaguanine synthase [Klebsiella pneumoniae subsp. pneumoniae]HCF6491198.1 7-cyano-7-deazaguanine synthase [Klebsiella variicola subsp. variicola]AWA36587.1 7-cyano-7-deazaguanine synthase [Klebsiella pneumoniae]EIW8710520.1 7-cyano-7-deazaguanine synthase [Klebsiella pneumoniae]EIW8718096.1 7-cyano-7-deazaguanine synthase [Klebsiella pneumoniae]
MSKRTGLILSGGMDSVCIAWWKKPEVAFTVDYGQKAANAEVQAAEQICKILNIEHHVLRVDCSSLGSGDLAGKASDKNAPETDWWPYRNQMLVTLIAMKAISLGINRLLIGTVSSDSNHKDGTFEFITLMSDILKFQEGNLVLEAPAINMTTYELICKSKIPYDYLLWAHSCHISNIPCGRCRGCNKYHQVINELNIL